MNVSDIKNVIHNELTDMAGDTVLHEVIPDLVTAGIDDDAVMSELEIWGKVRANVDMSIMGCELYDTEALLRDGVTPLDYYILHRSECDNIAESAIGLISRNETIRGAINKVVGVHVGNLWDEAMTYLTKIARSMESVQVLNIHGHTVRVWQGVDGDLFAETDGASLCAEVGNLISIARNSDPESRERALVTACVEWLNLVVMHEDN